MATIMKNGREVEPRWTSAHVAEYLGVHRGTISKWIKEGRLPVPKRISNRPYWDPQVILALMGDAD